MEKILNTCQIEGFDYKLVQPAVPVCKWNKFLSDMVHNNTYCPEPVRVIYNIGTKAYPILDENDKHKRNQDGKLVYGDPVKVLTTIVFFDDGTKVTVTNSEHDGIKFINQPVSKDPDAPTVLVADSTSKEAGFVYAMVKRLVGKPDENGLIQGDGFGRKLHDIVANAYDTALEEAKNKHKAKQNKAKHAAKQENAKPKAPRPSIAQTAVDFKNAVDTFKDMIEVFKHMSGIYAAKAAEA